MQTPTARVMPGTLSLVDPLHSDHLDWRDLQLEFDYDDSPWLHIVVLPKTGGRDTESLSFCGILQAQVRQILIRLFDDAFPHRDSETCQFQYITFARSSGREGPKGASHMAISLTGPSKTFVSAMSNHDWVKLAASWSQIVESQTKQRQALPK